MLLIQRQKTAPVEQIIETDAHKHSRLICNKYVTLIHHHKSIKINIPVLQWAKLRLDPSTTRTTTKSKWSIAYAKELNITDQQENAE